MSAVEFGGNARKFGHDISTDEITRRHTYSFLEHVMTHDRDADKPAGRTLILTRRSLFQVAFAAGGVAGIAGRKITAFAGERQREDRTRTIPPNLALRLAQFLNRTRFGDLPPKAIEHAKMIIASTLASAAPGSRHRLGAHCSRTGEGAWRQAGSHRVVRRCQAAGRRGRASQRHAQRRCRF